MDRPLWLDGRFVPLAEATLSVLAHAPHRGSLAFDFGTFHPTPKGVAVFRMREHLTRLRRSASLVGLEVPYDADALAAGTRLAVRSSGLREGFVRWCAFVSTLEPDLLPRSPGARVAIWAHAPSDLYGEGAPPAPKPATLRVAWFDDARKASPAAFPPLAKIGGAYVGPLIAKRRAREAGADEVILLDADGYIAEAPTSNVFAVEGGEIVTPPLGCILDGITRDSVLAIARAERIGAREQALTPAALAACEEVFLTSSSLPIAPVASVNGAVLQRGAPGEVTRRVKAVLLRAERGEDARFASWTTDGLVGT